MNPASSYHKFNGLLAVIASWLRSPFLLLVRLYWGYGFFQTGKGKLMHLERTAAYFQSLNIPMPKANAVLTGSVECIGGLLLLVGLGGRIVPLPLIIILITAYATADSEAAHAIFSDPDKFTSATAFLFLFATVIIFIFGPGKLSLDALIGKKTSSGE